MSQKKKYYVALYDEATKEVRFVTNTPKGKDVIREFVTDTTKAYRVGASNIDEAYEVFTTEMGIEATLVKIHYTRNHPVVMEIEL